MATKFYLHNKTAPYSPASFRGAWDATGSAVTKALDSASVPVDGSVIALLSIAEANATDEYDVLMFRGVSGPLKAGTIGTGTVNLMLGVYESSTSANLHWHVHIYVTQGDSDTVRGTLLSDYREAAGTNEWASVRTATALNAAASLSSLAVSAGDRLVVEIGYTARNTSATSYTGYLYYGVHNAWCPDLALGRDVRYNKGFIEFSEDLPGTADNRVSQGPVETLLTETTVTARASQGPVEVLMTDDANPARVSQVVAEMLSPVAVVARVTQLVAELLTPTVIETRTTQLVAELLDAGVHPIRVAQIVVELLGKSSTYCGPPSLSPAALCGKPDVLAWLEWTVPMKES